MTDPDKDNSTWVVLMLILKKYLFYSKQSLYFAKGIAISSSVCVCDI
jgi:hypothetical protein